MFRCDYCAEQTPGWVEDDTAKLNFSPDILSANFKLRLPRVGAKERIKLCGIYRPISGYGKIVHISYRTHLSYDKRIIFFKEITHIDNLFTINAGTLTLKAIAIESEISVLLKNKYDLMLYFDILRYIRMSQKIGTG